MKVILLVIDPATSQAAAGVLATNLARQKRARVVALRVVPLDFLGRGVGVRPRVDPDRAAQQVSSAVESLRQCGVPASGMVRTSVGGAAGEIAATAAQVHASLIVIGCPTSLLRGIGLGVLRARKLSRVAFCPVVIAESCWVGNRNAFGGWMWPRRLRHGA
jgi:nucleotide-binding universal stress UspA family protein